MLPKNKYCRQQKAVTGRAASTINHPPLRDTQSGVETSGPNTNVGLKNDPEGEKETRTSGPSKGSSGKVKQNGKGVSQNKSWFAALEDVDQEVDWVKKLEDLKQKIQRLPGPGKDGPPVNAHSRAKHKAHQLKQGSGSLSNGRLILTNSEGLEEGSNRKKGLAQGKVSSQYQPKDNHKRKPLLEVSNNLKEQSQSSKVLEKGETTSRSGSLVAMNPQLGLKEMEVEPPNSMSV